MWTAENRYEYERKAPRYPCDLTDEEWALVEPHLPPERNRKSARDLECHSLRADDRMPMARATKGLPAEEHRARLLRRMALRRHTDACPPCALLQARELVGKEANPTISIVDSQSVKGAEKGGPIDPFGYDAGKKIKGEKRHIAVDTLGLMHGLVVTPASIQDRDRSRRS